MDKLKVAIAFVDAEKATQLPAQRKAELEISAIRVNHGILGLISEYGYAVYGNFYGSGKSNHVVPDVCAQYSKQRQRDIRHGW